MKWGEAEKYSKKRESERKEKKTGWLGELSELTELCHYAVKELAKVKPDSQWNCRPKGGPSVSQDNLSDSITFCELVPSRTESLGKMTTSPFHIGLHSLHKKVNVTLIQGWVGTGTHSR